MKKILFLLVLLCGFPQISLAQTTEFSPDSECTNAGGFCRSTGIVVDDDSCLISQDTLGICDRTFPLNNAACCKFKDNGPVDPNNNGADPGAPTVPVIGQTKCQAPKSSNGWGGACRTRVTGPSACEDDPGEGEENFVGFCTPPGIGGDPVDCCVQKGTAIPNPTPSNYQTIAMDESTCEATYNANGSGYAGKCEDINDVLVSEFIEGKQATCDDTSQVVVGLCKGADDGGDIMNGCCVPKTGEYCQKLKTDNNGVDICNGASADAGSAGSLAYGDYKLLEQIPGSGNTSGKLQPYLESLYRAGFALIILGAIFMIGVGGFTYIASAGNSYAVKKGKGMITDAVIGLIVALLVWITLNIINPDLVNLQITALEGITFDANGTGSQIAGGNSTGTATSSLSAQEAAKKLLENSNVTSPSTYLFTTSCTNKTTTTTKANLQQVAEGKGMDRCSCGGGGNVAASETLLNSLVDLANAGAKFQINILAGACHSGGSNHYQGTAADIQRNSGLDSFIASKYTKTTCQGSKTGYQVGGVVVCFEDAGHYHVSPTGN